MGDHGPIGDGRLELDDLGAIIDRSTSLDGPATRPTDLLEGAEGPSWSERLETSGVTPWLRRHRVAVASVVAVAVLAAAGATTYVRTRPAPDDAVIAVGVMDTDPYGSSPIGAQNGVLSFAYTVTPQRPGDTVRVLGLDGPGVRASSAVTTEVTDDATGQFVIALNVVPGCDDPRIAKPAYGAYRLHVERANALGQVQDGFTDVPSGSVARWPDQILATCLQQWVDEQVTTEAVTVTPDPRTFSLTIEARVRSTLAHDLALNLFNQGGAVSLGDQAGMITAGTTSVVPLHFSVTDCSSPTWEFSRDPRSGNPIDGMPLYSSYVDAAISSDSSQAYVVLHWDHATQRRIESSFQSMCAGRPTAAVTVTSSALVVDRALEADAVSRGFDPAIVLRSRLEIRTPASHLVLGDTLSAADVVNGAPALIRTVTTAVRGGLVVVTFDWATSCLVQSNPPTVQLMLRSGGREWPVRVTIDSGALARAYLDACPAMSSGDLQNLQWNVGGPFQDTTGGTIVIPDSSPTPTPSY